MTDALAYSPLRGGTCIKVQKKFAVKTADSPDCAALRLLALQNNRNEADFLAKVYKKRALTSAAATCSVEPRQKSGTKGIR